MIKILSIDGGGIRGIIPAMMLTEIERRIGKPICKTFDFITGTSTGGILALALTKPDSNGNPQYTASELIELYEKEGNSIFSRSIWHRLKSLGVMCDEKYPSKGINSVLKKYFGAARMHEALTKVMVVSYETEQRIPWFFKSYRTKEYNEKAIFNTMMEAARATSAAPTYFEPAKVISNNIGNNYYSLIDGGVFANNPAMCAYIEAKSLFKDENEFLVLSLGTGEPTKPLLYTDIKDWGLANWAKPILDVVFDGVSSTTHQHLKTLLPENLYYRFQPGLDRKNESMDDATNENIRILKALSENFIYDNEEKFDELCKQLIAKSNPKTLEHYEICPDAFQILKQ